MSLDSLSRTAIKTRVHWLDNLDLVSGLVGKARASPANTYHLLAESTGSYNRNAHTSGYRSICGNARRTNLLVYEVDKIDLSGGSVCEKCRRKKAKMLEAHNALQT